MPKRSEANRKTNIGVARGVPVFLLAIIGYVSWTITKVICTDYLLNPPVSFGLAPQRGSAVAVLVTYYIALIVLLISYGRLLDTVTRRPGLIPRGPQWYAQKSSKGKGKSRGSSTRPPVRRGSRSEDEKSTETDLHDPKMPKEIEYLASESLPFRVGDFWLRDIFTCNADGRPRYCSDCYNWKPDRSHHCSELNRCVLKLDHFCPWVGGVVSETSYKFFIQFNMYGAVYTAHVLITTAYFFAQRYQYTRFVNGHWIAMLALSALFFLFSSGMLMSSGQFALINSTTIEHLDRKTKVWYLAVHADQRVLEEIHAKGLPIPLISYPRPPEENLANLAQDETGNASQASGTQEGFGGPPPTGYRTFAILETKPGVNPFDVGPLDNFTDIMGATVWEWILPIKPSPCLKHDDPTSLYRLGPAVDELKASTGVTSWNNEVSKRRRRRRRHRSRTRQADSGE